MIRTGLPLAQPNDGEMLSKGMGQRELGQGPFQRLVCGRGDYNQFIETNIISNQSQFGGYRMGRIMQEDPDKCG
jgi:hypothetical protein